MTTDVTVGIEAAMAKLRRHIILNYEDLRTLADGLRVTGLRLGATIGTYDMIHCGHSRYLLAASLNCDILFVAADSDAVVKAYKHDENRPLVPEDERLEMLLHAGHADYVTLINDVDDEGNWQYGFLDAVRPDVFVVSEGSYPDEQMADIRARCPEVIVLPRQAETSTSEKIRKLMLIQGKSLGEQLRALAGRVESGELSA